jgi:hypothetical protein
MCRVLLPGYDLLAELEPCNDGQLLFTDQVIPGSTLLGFAKNGPLGYRPTGTENPLFLEPAGRVGGIIAIPK